MLVESTPKANVWVMGGSISGDTVWQSLFCVVLDESRNQQVGAEAFGTDTDRRVAELGWVNMVSLAFPS